MIPFAVCLGWCISQLILNLGIQNSLDEFSKKSNNFQNDLQQYLNGLLKIFNLESKNNSDISVDSLKNKTVETILKYDKEEFLTKLCKPDIVQKKIM